jgi:protein ImuB
VNSCACLYASGNPALLLECARRFSPMIEQTSEEAVIFDVDGMGRLYSTPRQLAEAIVAQAGIPVRVAIASNPEAAWHAARGFRGITVIPPGEEAKTLAPLPLNLLGGSPQAAETLHIWGIRTFGQFAALPPLGVAARLGKEGVELQRLARGEGYRRLRLIEDALRFEDEIELEDPVALLEPLSFVLARLLNDLCARLSARSLATTEIRLRLTLEMAPPHEATLRLPVPMRDPKAFLKMLQLELGSRPPSAAVLKVWLALEPARPRTEQHGLFIPLSPEPEKLELTLARIRNLVGQDKAGTPEMLDTHRPDSFHMVALGKGPLSTAAPQPHMALRRFRPHKFAQVRLREGRPVHVTHVSPGISPGISIGGPVLTCAGPWRTAGEWWLSDPWAHDEWDVALADGGLFRIHCELSTGRWFFEGRYD